MKWLSLGGSAVDKGAAYRELVARRKACRQCAGLMNPSVCCGGRLDSDQIGPWTLWQGALDARVLIVGQDWGDTRYFTKWGGRDQPHGNPTNENLRRLLASIGIQIGRPMDSQGQVVFMTNLILCLKEGGLQAPVRPEWFSCCARTFLRPLIELIKPAVVLGLGQKTSAAILDAHGVTHARSASYSDMVGAAPYRLVGETWLFPLYHCGAGSVNRNRSLAEQEADWGRVRGWLDSRSRRGQARGLA